MTDTVSNQQPPVDDRQLAHELHQARKAIGSEIGRRIVGQEELVDHLLITLFARGHGLFVGLPGLAKTLLIQSLADVLDLAFSRIQFTPDLMPSDITGTDILDSDDAGIRSFRFVKGPVFCNILLADEINRTPPKTQAALLQSMQEGKVTAGGRTYQLNPPFHVFATQNPIEQEGTYPLPEAQLDRFMMMLKVDYPTTTEEEEIIRRTTSRGLAQVSKAFAANRIHAFQDLVLRVPISEPLIQQAVRVVRLTRPTGEGVPSSVKEFVTYGAGPRAGQHLVMAAKARAILQGRPAVDGADIEALAYPVLRHRVLTNFQAEARKVSPDDIIRDVLRSA